MKVSSYWNQQWLVWWSLQKVFSIYFASIDCHQKHHKWTKTHGVKNKRWHQKMIRQNQLKSNFWMIWCHPVCVMLNRIHKRIPKMHSLQIDINTTGDIVEKWSYNLIWMLTKISCGNSLMGHTMQKWGITLARPLTKQWCCQWILKIPVKMSETGIWSSWQ